MKERVTFKLLSSFIWPEKIDNPIAVFEAQIDKFWKGEYLFFERATEEELKEAVQEQLQKAKDELERFKNNPYKSNIVIACDTTDEIRYAFRNWCMIKNLSQITFDEFKKFAEEYNVQHEIIQVDAEPEELAEDLDDYLNDETVEKVKTDTYKFIYEVEVDMLMEQWPREWYKYITFYDKEGKPRLSSRYDDPRMTMYEEDVNKKLYFK